MTHEVLFDEIHIKTKPRPFMLKCHRCEASCSAMRRTKYELYQLKKMPMLIRQDKKCTKGKRTGYQETAWMREAICFSSFQENHSNN